LGGGFGGKEDQASAWAALVALAALCIEETREIQPCTVWTTCA
jgi:xanthine dehydrogenase molybdopterin-binding subunit B